MTRKLRSSTPATDPDPTPSDTVDKAETGWAQMGENVSWTLAETRRGERDKVVNAFATTYGTYSNKIWKAVGAYGYLAKIEDRRLKRLLAEAPLSLVDLLALWHSHDKEGALKAAADVAEGRHTFQTLLAAERAARPQTKSTVSSRAAAWREAAKEALITGAAEGYTEATTPKKLAEFPVDLWLSRREIIVGIQLLGPFPNRRDYSRNAPLRTMASLGLAHLGYQSWIALPVETAGQRYKEIAERIAPGVLKIVELEDLPDFSDL